MNSLKTLNDSNSLMMQHFITHTRLTLATDENTRQTWQVIVPELAYRHEFLMHALLACTAVHMAHLNPDQHSELTIKAITHQDLAMPLFRATISSLESETCDAVYVFALLMAVTVLASDDRRSVAEEQEDKLPSWLFFIQSGCE